VEPHGIFPALGSLQSVLPKVFIFDVDGTLQDSAQWWPQLCAEGVADFGAARALDLPQPDHELAYSVIGKADAGVWPALLPEEHRDLWRELRSFLVARQVELLSAGTDYSFPGTHGLLAWLRSCDVRIALASNCRQAYLDAMLEGQRLGGYVDAAYCLDSPGIETKVDMLRAILAELGTRDAIMIGDRESDQEAAMQNGIPFVHRTGFHAAGELTADFVISSSADLVRVLVSVGQFWVWLLERISGRGRVAVTGCPGVGKSLFAQRLAALSRRSFLDQDAFLRRAAEDSPDTGHLERALDLPAFQSALHRAPMDCVVAGLFLTDARLLPEFDYVIQLEADEERIVRQISARDGEESGHKLRCCWLPAWREHVDSLSPKLSRLVIDNTLPLGPDPVFV
jgi:phosphoglycolate phosphatase-like HAD superfamily hydrolase